jgi:serine/threonine protein phosphatase 1
VVILVATLIGAYGLFALHSGSGQPSLVAAPDYAGFLTGTFVNRNTAATYLAIALVASAARFLETVGAAPPAAPRQRHGRRERSFGGLYVIAAAVLATALFSTGSRAGLIAALMGLGVTLVVGSRGLLRSGGRAWVVIVGAGIAVAAVALLAAGSVLDRIGEEAVADDTRFAVYSETLGMIEDRPLLGHGAGTFATLFPLYHGPGVPSERVWLAAHNTYLQAAAELGLPALAVMLLVLAGAFVNVLAHALSPRAAAATVAATGAIVVVAVHAFLDFSLQVEAVAILFAILVGAGTGVSLGDRAVPAPGVESPPPAEGAGAPNPPAVARAQLRYALVEETAPAVSEAAVPRRIYVFGDLHGRSDLAADLKAAIARDLAESPSERPLIVGLGDYVDRGPDSRGVIELLLDGLHPDAEHVFIRGNHEQLLIDALAGDEQAYDVWVHSGGLDTLRSYGIDIREALRGEDGFEAVRRAFARTLPYSHFDFLRATPIQYDEGTYLFVHGGVDPAKPLGEQAPEDLLWHRHEDQTRDDVFERIVVHGHTPVSEPFLGRYRVNLDTGAYASNRLSCLVLEGDRRRLLALSDGR